MKKTIAIDPEQLTAIVRAAVRAELDAQHGREQARRTMPTMRSRDVVKATGQSIAAVAEACRAGALPAVRYGKFGPWHIRREDVDAWAARGYPIAPRGDE